MSDAITIDAERLARLLAGINAFGQSGPAAGFDRIGFSEPDMAARRWLLSTMVEEGLDARMDGAGNVWGRFGPSDGPAVVVGSHLDTVPAGGAYDGALGVAAALEAVLSLKAQGHRPAVAIEVLATAEEEGRFGGMLGSQAIVGRLDKTWIEAARDANGVLLTDAMRAAGLDPLGALSAQRSRDEIAAFLELHIEQGPILEAEGLDIGIVHTISGMASIAGALRGRANHSGTTPMDMRADAFAGLASFAAEIPGIVRDHGSQETRVTIGHVELRPNYPHTIPGAADFTLILRDTDEGVMRRMAEALEQRLAAVATAHRLAARLAPTTWLEPVALDASLATRIDTLAEKRGIRRRSMPSGAGHDAQTMQALCPSALIFVPSRDGVSHAPEEFTQLSSIVTGADLLLRTLADWTGKACPLT